MTDENYRTLISQAYPKLGKKNKVIADVLLNDPESILTLNAYELAARCGCNQTTVVRLAQKLGYKGYSELKIAITRDCGAFWKDYEPVSKNGEAFNEISNKLMQLHTETIQRLVNNLNEANINALIAKISSSQKVMICGSGASRLAAEDLNMKLMRQGINTIYFADSQMWKVFLGYLDENDVLILISHSGETTEIVNLAKSAHDKGIYIASMTGFEGSRLAELTDCLLLTECSGERSIRIGAMTSRTAQLFIIDLIAICHSFKDKEHSWDLLVKSYEFTDKQS